MEGEEIAAVWQVPVDLAPELWKRALNGGKPTARSVAGEPTALDVGIIEGEVTLEVRGDPVLGGAYVMLILPKAAAFSLGVRLQMAAADCDAP